MVVVTLKDEQLESVSHYFLYMVTTKKKHGISLLSGSTVNFIQKTLALLYLQCTVDNARSAIYTCSFFLDASIKKYKLIEG